MLKLIFLLFNLSYTLAQTTAAQSTASPNGQCAGPGYNGPSTCPEGYKCFQQNQYWAQCLVTCPTSGWSCNVITSATTTGTSTSTTTTTAASGTTRTTTTTSSTAGGKFPDCRFRFGMAYDGSMDYSAADYITIWIGSPSSSHGTDFNPYWHGEMVKEAAQTNKMIVFYAYIIGFMAGDQWGLLDCHLGSPSLCEEGADYIRAHRVDIIAKYKHYATETAKIYGKTKESIWLIEPNLWQYYGDIRQQNGVLSGSYMRQLFDDIAKAIKFELPNARMSWDISTALSESAMNTWWSYFAASTHIEFIHTSGGQSKANSANIKPNELRWAFMATLTGRKIIADTGYYGAGGASGTGHSAEYDSVNNLNARIKDGVIAVSQANPKSDWGNTLNTLRAVLPKLC